MLQCSTQIECNNPKNVNKLLPKTLDKTKEMLYNNFRERRLLLWIVVYTSRAMSSQRYIRLFPMSRIRKPLHRLTERLLFYGISVKHSLWQLNMILLYSKWNFEKSGTVPECRAKSNSVFKEKGYGKLLAAKRRNPASRCRARKKKGEIKTTC